MARLSTGAEAIVAAFRPQVAVLHGDDVSRLCRKNNVDNLADLLLPFSDVGVQVTLRDPTSPSAAHTLDGFSVEFRDVRAHAFVRAGAPLDHVCAEAVRAVPIDLAPLPPAGPHPPVLPDASTLDWYEVFGETLLRWAEPGEHEFVRHYVAAVLAVASDADDPPQRLAALSQAHNELQHGSAGEVAEFTPGPYRSASKWMLANTLKYYVLVHDVLTGDANRAKSLYESMQNTYGEANCCLLCINSSVGQGGSVEPLPDLWSAPLGRRYRGLAAGVTRATASAASDTAKALTTSAESAGAYFDIGEPVEAGAARDEALVNGLIANVQGQEDSCSQENVSQEQSDVGRTPEPAKRRFRQESIPHALSNDDLASSAGTNGLSSLDASAVSSSANDVGPPACKSSTRGDRLLAEDRDRLGACVADFVVKALVPYIEKQMKLLNEQVISRKGLHKSFISGARKWLAGSSPALPPMGTQAQSPGTGAQSASNVNLAGLGTLDERSASPAPPPPGAQSATATALSYGRDSGELQIRRFADLAFVCRQYYLAYQTYQTLRRDFHSDQAWLYYAGAMEMSALCAFLISQQQAGSKPYSHSSMDTAIATYLNTCNRQTLALRATLLGVSILSTLRMHAECAQSLIRLSGHDSDLCAAVMLERAARCMYKANGKRKAALHLVLAGHRYAKAGNGPLALRCYAAARAQYASTGLRFAVDHVNYTIGRHALALLPSADTAVHVLSELFGGPHSHVGTQSAAQHALFVAEYIAACNKLASESGKLPELKVPYFDMSSVNVFLGGSIHDWAALRALDDEQPSGELTGALARAERCCARACSSNALGGRGLQHHFAPAVGVCNGRTDNSRQAHTPIGEPLCVRVLVRNRLNVRVALSDVALRAVAADGRRVPVIGEPRVPSADASLAPMDETEIYCAVLPDESFAGQSLTISAVEYTLCVESDGVSAERRDSVRGQCSLRARGRRLNVTKQHMLTAMYAKDLRLHPAVAVLPSPLADVTLASDWRSPERDCLCGETVACELAVRDAAVRPAPLAAVALASVPPAACALTDARPLVDEDREAVAWCIAGCSGDSLPTPSLLRRTVYLKAPSVPGRHVIRILVYYECQRADGSRAHRSTVRAVVLFTSGALRLSARLLQPSFTSGAGRVHTVCVRAANTRAADESESQRRPAVFRLRRVSLVVPDGVPACLRLKVLRPTLADDEIALRYGEVENVCVHTTVVDEPSVSSTDLYVDSRKTSRAFVPTELLPWRASAVLTTGDQTFCAVHWSATFEDGGEACGETWTTVADADGDYKAPTVGEPATVSLQQTFGGTDARSTVAAMAAHVDLLGVAAALLRCTITVPPVVVHDFSASTLCVVPVTLSVRWCATAIKRQRPVGEADSPPLDPLCALDDELVLSVAPADVRQNALRWVGLVKLDLPLGMPPVPPDYKCGEATASLQAMVPLPGVYSSAGLQLHARLRAQRRSAEAASRPVVCEPFSVTVVDRRQGATG